MEAEPVVRNTGSRGVPCHPMIRRVKVLGVANKEQPWPLALTVLPRLGDAASNVLLSRRRRKGPLWVTSRMYGCDQFVTRTAIIARLLGMYGRYT